VGAVPQDQALAVSAADTTVNVALKVAAP